MHRTKTNQLQAKGLWATFSISYKKLFKLSSLQKWGETIEKLNHMKNQKRNGEDTIKHKVCCEKKKISIRAGLYSMEY